MMIKWLDTILDYNFTVVHLPGINNVLPDNLSRLFPCGPELTGGHSPNAIYESMYPSTNTKVNRAAHLQYYRDNKLEPPTEEERRELLEKAHVFGHFGAEAIVKTIHNNGIHWPNLKEQAIELVKACQACQRFNTAKHGYHPLRSVNADLPGDH